MLTGRRTKNNPSIVFAKELFSNRPASLQARMRARLRNKLITIEVRD